MKRKIFFFLMILICVCAISHVSAQNVDDNATDDVIASEDMNLDENLNDKLAESSNTVLANQSGEPSNGTGDTNTSDDDNTTPPVGVEKQKAKIKVSKLTAVHKKSTKWTIKLVDANGKGIAGKKITLKIYTGSKYKTVKVSTNSKGVASYNTKSLKTGTHKVKLSFADDNYTCGAVSSSIKVIKQTPIKFTYKTNVRKDGSALLIKVFNKKTKKPINGVKLQLKIYTGKKYKTITIKTKKYKGKKGLAGYATNELSAGKHKVKITPVALKYKGSKTVTLKIKKSAKKYSSWTSTL